MFFFPDMAEARTRSLSQDPSSVYITHPSDSNTS